MALRNENFLLRRYIEKAMVDLPALPNVVITILSLTERETVSARELEQFISSDQAIMTKLLKVVNSAYFGLPRQISNIGQAVTILGLNQVRNLVLSIGVLNALSSPSPRIVEYQRKYWEHAFTSASIARLIAGHKRFSKEDAEMAFTGGMLHDIGRLFLYTLFNLPYQDVLRESIRKQEEVTIVEARVLGVTHADLGGALAERWNFPQALVDVIREHDRIGEGFENPLVLCVHMADRIANNFAGADVTGHFGGPDPRAMEWLNMTDIEIAQIEAQAREHVSKTAELLGIL